MKICRLAILALLLCSAARAADLHALVDTMKPGDTLVVPDGEYPVGTSFLLTHHKGCTIRASKAAIIRCTNQLSLWKLMSAGITIDGFTTPQCGTYCQFQADNGTIQNGDVAWQQPVATRALIQLAVTRGGKTCAVRNMRCGVTQTVSVYWYTDHFEITGCSFEGSVAEYVLRSDTNDGILYPHDFLIADNEISNLPANGVNYLKKPAIGIRVGGGIIRANRIHGLTYFGQSGAVVNPPPGKYGTVLADGNTFDGTFEGNAYMTIRQGMIVHAVSNKFVLPVGAPIVIAGGSELFADSNVGTIVKPPGTVLPVPPPPYPPLVKNIGSTVQEANTHWVWNVPAIPATSVIQALTYSAASPGIKAVPLASEHLGSPVAVGYTRSQEFVSYDNLDFGTGVKSWTASVGCPANSAGHLMVLRLDSTTGPIIGTLRVASSGGWYVFQNQTCPVSGATGIHSLWICFDCGTSGQGAGNLRDFTFLK